MSKLGNLAGVPEGVDETVECPNESGTLQRVQEVLGGAANAAKSKILANCRAAIASLGLVAAVPAAAAADEQKNPFGAPLTVAANAEGAASPFGNPLKPRPNIADAATEGALLHVTAKLSAEDQEAITAYNDYLRTGKLNPHVQVAMKALVDRFHRGELAGTPEHDLVAKMLATEAILKILEG